MAAGGERRPNGRLIITPWSPKKHAYYAMPNENTLRMEIGAIAKVENTKFGDENDGDLLSLIEKIGKPAEEQRSTAKELFQQLKQWLEVTHLQKRVELEDKTRQQLEGLPQLPEDTIKLGQLQHIVTFYIIPMLKEAKSGEISKHIGMIGGTRRRTKKHTIRRRRRRHAPRRRLISSVSRNRSTKKRIA